MPMSSLVISSVQSTSLSLSAMLESSSTAAMTSSYSSVIFVTRSSLLKSTVSLTTARMAGSRMRASSFSVTKKVWPLVTSSRAFSSSSVLM